MKTRQRTKAPPMTKYEAVRFDRYSVANAVTVATELECGCEAYQDVFTYKRWKAQGFQVERGERAIKLPQVREVERENPDTGAMEQRKVFHTSAVFCRHQVAEVAV